MNRISIILIALSCVVPVLADSDQYQGSTLIDKYREALAHQQDALRNLSMEVHMEGRIPKLKKEGKMSALRKISCIGQDHV